MFLEHCQDWMLDYYSGQTCFAIRGLIPLNFVAIVTAWKEMQCLA